MARSSTDRNQRPLRQLRTIAGLIETPVLARIYAYAEREGPVTVGELVDELEIPQGTAYDYVQRLEGAGLLKQTNDSRPYEYAAEAISLTLSVDGTTTTITPALVAAIARLEDDEDVEVFVERHGLDGLAEALEYAFGQVAGTVNHRIMARELDLSPLEAEIILQALEPVAAAYSDTVE
jgi:predicted ArsR family transcriptional regulator